jgi:acetyl esterase/lipase
MTAMRLRLLVTAAIVSTVRLASGQPAATLPATSPSPSPTPYRSNPVDTAHGDRESLLLWPDGAPGALGTAPEDRPKITIYRAPAGAANGTAVLVCPGGSYRTLASAHEGKDVAEWLNTLGVSAFVLQYRLGPRYRHPVPLQDAQRALRLLRSRAKDFGLDPGRLGILGFSAGGHLSATTGTHFDEGRRGRERSHRPDELAPDFMVLAYPVMSMTAPFSHKPSIENLLGPSPDPALAEDLSNEKRVTVRTPPAFLFHTADDPGVSVENSLVFAHALQQAGVPVELHVFPKGKHGVGLAPGDPVLSQWPGLCASWLRAMGLLAPLVRRAGGPRNHLQRRSGADSPRALPSRAGMQIHSIRKTRAFVGLRSCRPRGRPTPTLSRSPPALSSCRPGSELRHAVARFGQHNYCLAVASRPHLERVGGGPCQISARSPRPRWLEDADQCSRLPRRVSRLHGHRITETSVSAAAIAAPRHANVLSETNTACTHRGSRPRPRRRPTRRMARPVNEAMVAFIRSL